MSNPDNEAIVRAFLGGVGPTVDGFAGDVALTERLDRMHREDGLPRAHVTSCNRGEIRGS